jgi:hypothetical protein
LGLAAINALSFPPPAFRQAIFEDDPSVLYMSLHRFGHNFFPGTGAAAQVTFLAVGFVFKGGVLPRYWRRRAGAF